MLDQAKGPGFHMASSVLHTEVPLFTGYFSQFVKDELPRTTIAYMDPISLPPTRNDVVQETMVRSVKVAQETNQEFAVVTYDLAIALFKLYSLLLLISLSYCLEISILSWLFLEQWEHF